MSDDHMDWSDLYPKSDHGDLDKAENQQNCQTINDIKFCKNLTEDLENYGPDHHTGYNTRTDEKITVHEKFFKDNSEAYLIKNDIQQTHKLQIKNITSVLKIRSIKISDNQVHLFYQFYNFTFRKFIERKANSNVPEDDLQLKYLLTKIFKAIDLIHSKGVVIKNVSQGNIAIVEEDEELKPKIFNLSMAKESENIEEQLEDRKDVGILLLSIIVGDQEAQDMAIEFKKRTPRDVKFNLIYEAVKDIKWIHRTNLKNFADLIACLLNAKPQDELSKFSTHAFFFNRESTLEYLSAVNGRLSLSQDDRSKNSPKGKQVDNRKKVLNKIMIEGNEERFEEIHQKLKDALGDFAPRDATLTERSREARNKEVHLEDDTDIELDETDDCNEANMNRNSDSNSDTKSIQTVDNENIARSISSLQLNNETQNSTGCKSKAKSNAKKCPVAWKKVSRFLHKKGGAINVHLEADEDFLYDIFNNIRILAFNPNIKRFYIDSFLFDDPEKRYDDILKIINATESTTKPEEATNEPSKKTTNFSPPVNVPSRSYNDQNEKLRNQNKYDEPVRQNPSKKHPKDGKVKSANNQHPGTTKPPKRESRYDSSRSSQNNFVIPPVHDVQQQNIHMPYDPNCIAYAPGPAYGSPFPSTSQSPTHPYSYNINPHLQTFNQAFSSNSQGSVPQFYEGHNHQNYGYDQNDFYQSHNGRNQGNFSMGNRQLSKVDEKNRYLARGRK